MIFDPDLVIGIIHYYFPLQLEKEVFHFHFSNTDTKFEYISDRKMLGISLISVRCAFISLFTFMYVRGKFKYFKELSTPLEYQIIKRKN